MKNLITLTLVLLLSITNCISQNIEPAPEGKAVVYFVRTSSIGFAINFRYFDNDKYIGKFNGPKYMRYECEPGNHLFWAKSENKAFVEAELEAGKIYFIQAIPKMGAIKAGVHLEPANPNDKKSMIKITKLLNKKPSESFAQEELEKETIELNGLIVTSLEKYEKIKEKGKNIVRLDKSMYYTN